MDCKVVPHVDFIDSKGHVHELVFVPTLTGKGDWKDEDLTELAKSGSTAVARSPLAGYSGGQTRSDVSQHLNYIASDGHVHELYASLVANLRDNDLTKLAASSSNHIATLPAEGSPLSGYWDTLNRQHVNYIASDGHVHELYVTPGNPWKDNDLTKLAKSSSTATQGVRGVWSPLSGYWDTLNRQHVNYIDRYGHVHELYNTPTTAWKDNDLTKLAKSSSFAEVGRSKLDGYWDTLSRQHVNYIASDGHVHELYNTPTTGGWKDNDLTKLAKSSSIPGVWSTLRGYWGWGENHVNYIDSDGHVHELYDSHTTAWKDNDLTELSREENAQSASTAITGSSLAGYWGNTNLFPTKEGAAVNYIDSNGHVHEMLNVRPEVMQNSEWKDVDLMAVAAIFPQAQGSSSSSLYGYMSNALIK